MEKGLLEERSVSLRAELKQWEKEFAATHDGRKATRDEIKQDVTIAAKYKEYYKAQDILARNPTSKSTPRKRKAAAISSTPKKSQVDAQIGDASPEQERTPVAPRMFVGPTPQKDGRVLGLFDLLPVESTPCKTSRFQEHLDQDSAIPFGVISGNLLTPKRTKSQYLIAATKPDNEALSRYEQKRARTPESASKRALLDSFVTPSKRYKRADETNAESKWNRTPSSTSKTYSTPLFLRRDSQPVSLEGITEEADQEPVGMASPSGSRREGRKWQGAFHRRLAFGKQTTIAGRKRLSSMIADIRRHEDDRLDEELEMLHEAESEAAVADAARDKNLDQNNDRNMLGPDGATAADIKAALQADGAEETSQHTRIWKKRGQKRTTRRVNMKPVARRPTTTTAISNDAQDESLSTITDLNPKTTDMYDEEAEPESDEDNDDGDAKPRKRRRMDLSDPSEKENPVLSSNTAASGLKKVARKVSAAAHANFRRLKIRGRKPFGKK